MKSSLPFRVLSFLGLGLLLSGVAAAQGLPSPDVRYNPVTKSVQGNQPLNQSYTLSISLPSTVPANSTLSIPLVPTLLSKPGTVDDATALSFITITPSVLTVTGPSQTKQVTVSVVVPLGNFAGDYAYKIFTSGWPASLTPAPADNGATVNAYVSPATTIDTTPPEVSLLTPADGSSYTYYAATNTPAAVTVQFAATVGAGGQPISAMKAYLDNTPITVTTTGIGTLAATASGTVQISQPGAYTVRVQAMNLSGTSEASAGISVILNAPPPTIAVVSPLANTTFTYTTGGPGAAVPISFTATSAYGNVTAVSALLNGAPVTLGTSPAGTSVTGSATLNLTAGDYTLVCNATNAYGAATPVNVPFKVRSLAPTPVLPTVAITSPATGTVYTRTQGTPATVVSYTFTAGTTVGTITEVTVTLDGVAQAPVVTGLNTAAVSGGGNLSFSSGGTHTLSVTARNADGSTSASTSFSIQENPANVCQNLTWLPPISLNKTVEGGSTVPIKFTLTCNSRFVRDPTTLISISEVYADGSLSAPVIYPYGANGNPNPPDYSIAGSQYHLNFTTARGVHRYRIEVFHPLTADGSLYQLLGTKDLLTKGRDGRDCSRDDDDDRDHDRDHDRDCDNDRDNDRDRDCDGHR